MSRQPFGDDIRRTLLIFFTVFAVLPVLVAIAFMTRTADQAISRTAEQLTQVGSQTLRESAGKVASTGQERLDRSGEALQRIARKSLEDTSGTLISTSRDKLSGASSQLIAQGSETNRQLSERLIALSQAESTQLSAQLIADSQAANAELGKTNEKLAERALVETTDQLVARTQVLTNAISDHLIGLNQKSARELSDAILADVEKEPVVNFKTLATIFAQGIAGGKVLPIQEGYLAVVDGRGRVLASTKHRKGASLRHLDVVSKALDAGSPNDELIVFQDGKETYLGVFARREEGGAVVFAYLADKARMDTERMKADVQGAIAAMGQTSSGYVREALASNVPAIRREATALSEKAIAEITAESRASTERTAKQMGERAEATVARARERMAAQSESIAVSSLSRMEERSREISSRAIAEMEPIAQQSVASAIVAMQQQAERSVDETAAELKSEVEASGARAVERMPPAAERIAHEARMQSLMIAVILLVLEVGLALLLSMVLSGRIAAPILTERQKSREEQERLKRELEIASQIQLSMLPQAPPVIPGVDIAFYFQPVDEVGGDYYDLIRVGNQLAIAVGDVNGHGLGAALLMAMAKSAFHTQAGRDPDVSAVMTGLNEMVFGATQERRFMTFFYALIDLDTRRMVYSNAGHHYPYQLESTLGRLTSLQPSAYPLGVRQNTKFPVRTATISEGDLLVFYSDGIIEARNPEGEEFGFERFEQAIWLHQKHSADTIKTSILAELSAFQQGIRQDDDITLVVVQFNPEIQKAVPAVPAAQVTA